MIKKNFELDNFNSKHNIYLFYGKNEGLKNEIINKLNKDKKEITSYEEKEILANQDVFLESVSSKSLFEEDKIISIKRATDKLLELVKVISEKNIENIIIIINADILEKKSKLRSFFEKHKNYITVPFYPDTDQTLSKLCYNFLKEKNLTISQSNINLIINKCGGDRENLQNELIKIEFFSKNGKKITEENIVKLTNLIENHSISELIDNCLVNNKKKITAILNDNNFSNEDCILIIRAILNKSKKLLTLSSEFNHNKNLELTISSAKPPIFWKDKEITKQQIIKWTPEKIKQLIFKLTEIELLVKKNSVNSINLITDFILDQTFLDLNN